ncbi:ABC transporter ATP-binding protein [Mangrovicoccus sp. HB161399]|uniref:ABC transporter ATP-binding protein n=1 Tax=Mangrovicoccus sp. HB161399 TaxID=2720392 RepID=UPI001551AEE2|nr:ABC transporter ATP-binding protein [Mangrovicoccus sp. HB161399]
MARISVEGLSKSFGAYRVFEDLDLAIPKGSYVCLLGPSGCGKSTLMRMIAGLDTEHGGHIRFDGKPVEHLTAAQRDVGMAFQNYALYPHLTVEGNLRFPMKAPLQKGRWSAAQMTERVGEVADLLQIRPLLGRAINQLSGGQQQRVSLGRALVRHPKVLLLDEPVTHLDARLRYAMRSELKRIHKVMGTTTVHVTHDQGEALAMADLLVIMRGGRIEQAAPAMEVYSDPATAFVAGFLGAVPRTVLTLPLSERDGTAGLRLGGQHVPLPPALVAAARQAGGGTVTIALPASAFAVDPDGPVEGTVAAHEMIEGAQRLVLQADGQRVNIQRSETAPVANGDRLRFRVDASEGLLFDAATGDRLRPPLRRAA